MKKIYVCSPYKGRIKQNTKNARLYCRYVIYKGHLPIAPHLLFTQFLADSVKAQRKLGLALGLELLAICDEIWVFGRRITAGMALDIAEAVKIGKPIQYIEIISRT